MVHFMKEKLLMNYDGTITGRDKRREPVPGDHHADLPRGISQTGCRPAEPKKKIPQWTVARITP